MAYFNYFKFQLHLRVLLSSDFDKITLVRDGDVMCIEFVSDYCDLRDKLMSCLDTLVEFNLIAFISRKEYGSVVSLRYTWNFDSTPF